MSITEKLLQATDIKGVRIAISGLSPERQAFELSTALQQLYVSSEEHIAEHRTAKAITDLSRMALLEDALDKVEEKLSKAVYAHE